MEREEAATAKANSWAGIEADNDQIASGTGTDVSGVAKPRHTRARARATFACARATFAP